MTPAARIKAIDELSKHSLSWYKEEEYKENNFDKVLKHINDFEHNISVLNEEVRMVQHQYKTPNDERDSLLEETISFEVGDEIITFDLQKSMRFPLSDEDTCHSANITDLSVVDSIKEILPQNHDNSIEPILDHLPEDCNNPALFAANSIDEEIPTPKLKELPSHLEYAFLNNNREYLSSSLRYYLARKKGILSMPFQIVLRCEEMISVLNWEKYHFMVKEGIVLGHKISKAGIEVDKAKVDVIASLPYPTNVKDFELMCDASDYAIGAVLVEITRGLTTKSHQLVMEVKYDNALEHTTATERN
ncbi:hypothetical protein Tco_0608575 [Tanacetum coccineum]